MAYNIVLLANKDHSITSTTQHCKIELSLDDIDTSSFEANFSQISKIIFDIYLHSLVKK